MNATTTPKEIDMNSNVAAAAAFDAGFGTAHPWRCEVCGVEMGMWDTVLYRDGEYKACGKDHARILNRQHHAEVRRARRTR
jgi:hypothetical protein